MDKLLQGILEISKAVKHSSFSEGSSREVRVEPFEETEEHGTEGDDLVLQLTPERTDTGRKS